MTRSRFEPGSPKAQIGTYNGERELLSKRHGYFSGILGPVAQWIRHLTTNQGIPGSSPGRIGSFDLPKMNTGKVTLKSCKRGRILCTFRNYDP